MTDELKPCPFCGSPARLNRSTGESLWSHDQVEWTQVQCTNEDCGVATENRCEGWAPTPIESWNTRVLTTSQPAQAAQTEREQLRSAQADAVMPLIGPLLDAWENTARDVMSQEPELSKQLKAINTAMEGASLPTQPAAQTDSMGMPTSCGKPLCLPDEHHPLCKLHQPAAQATPYQRADIGFYGAEYQEQATPEPVGEPFAWTSMGQIRFTPPTQDHDTYTPLYTRPAPGVPDGEPKLTQEELLEVAKHAWLMARTADSLQFYRTLLAAAAQAKGVGA